MANSWFRLYSEFSTDPKVQMLSESDQRRLVMLFCFRCNGHETLQDEEVTFLLRISNEEWNGTKDRFIKKGFIDKNNELLNWDKRQYSSDSSSERVRSYRERKKQEKESKNNNETMCNDDETLHETNCNGIDTEQIQNRTDTETTIDTNVSIAGNENQIPICPHQEIINLYAKHLPMGLQPRTWDGQRAALLKTRWRESKKRQDLPWWDSFFAYIAKSDFLTGRTSSRDRKAFEIDLPWILKAENFKKIIDGKYENK